MALYRREQQTESPCYNFGLRQGAPLRGKAEALKAQRMRHLQLHNGGLSLSYIIHLRVFIYNDGPIRRNLMRATIHAEA